MNRYIVDRVNPAQLKDYRTCERRWWYNYPAKRRPAASADQHAHRRRLAQLEAILCGAPEDGKDGRVREALRHFPAHHPGRVEAAVPIRLRTAWNSTSWIDQVDCIDMLTPLHVMISVASVDKLPTPALAHLMTDLQMVGYARWAFMRWSVLSIIDVARVYIQQQGPSASTRVDARFTWADVEAVWPSMMATARDILIAAVEPEPECVGVSPRACSRSGGCPHRSYCSAEQ